MCVLCGCIHGHPQILKSKAAQCGYINSGEFCDCMQIDLIDYRSNERCRVYGQVAHAIDYGCEIHWFMQFKLFQTKYKAHLL